MKNKAAQQLGRKGKGKPKTMTDAAIQQRKDANKARWSKHPSRCKRRLDSPATKGKR